MIRMNTATVFGSDVNNVANTRQIYPEAGGATVGTRASALTPYTAGRGPSYAPSNTLVDSGKGTVTPQGQDPNQSGDGAGGVVSRPLTWWLVLAILLVALMFFAQRFGSEKEDFRNLKLSAYNILVISLAAMVGFGVFKAIFGRFQVPGLSTYVAAV